MSSPSKFLLLLVSVPGVNTDEDFIELARWISEFDPRILVRVGHDSPSFYELLKEANLPSLVFSPGPLRRLTATHATVCTGRWLPKSIEYQRLETQRLPVPRFRPLSPARPSTFEDLGQYVVVKPEFGARGADVRIARSSGLSWRPPTTRVAKVLGGVLAPSVVQEFVYTGPFARSYRVTTLFGEVLWSLSVEAGHHRKPLHSPNGFAKGETGAGTSIVSSGKGCQIAYCNEPDVLNLAQQAHQAFPEFGLLGFDLVRDYETQKLFIVEANSAGLCWHFSSETGQRLNRELGLSLESQFNGRRIAARILAEQTVRLAK
jgi:hypothetical protein